MDRQEFEPRRRGRGGMGVIWLLALFIAATMGTAHAADPALQISANTPVQMDALPRAEFDAIVVEAQTVAARPRHGIVTPLPAHWRTLDPVRLSAMLRMPAFAQVPESTRGVLLDQAATWDLLTFRRPSDAAVLWERIWPRSPYADPKAAPNSTGIGYEPDPTWSPTSMAMSTIFACFPTEVWSASGDALVSAIRNPSSFQWRNEEGWDGFRQCIPDGAFFGETRPNKAGLAAVMAVLKTKFTDQLLAHDCTRPGPDSCLLLFQALASLDHRNPQLSVILKRLEPAFDLDAPLELPSVTTPKIGDDLSPADLKALEAPETEALRRSIFLAHKLPVLLREPTAWPPGELERTLTQAMRYAVVRARVEHLEVRRQRFDRYYTDPWQWIDAKAEARLAAGQRALGADYARREACALADIGLKGGTAAFWQGYVAENIRLGNGHCEQFYKLQLAELYRAAKAARGVRAQEQAMQPLQPIAATLMQAGPLRELALGTVTEICGKKAPAASRDPWQLCAGVAARAAKQAEEERARVAEERARIAALPPAEKWACEEGTAARAAEALQSPFEPEFWNDTNSACRLDPAHPTRAFIALAYPKGEARDPNNGEDVYDLDVIVMNVRDGTLVAHRHEDAAITADAITFDGMSIDTGPYPLAPGTRAFGVQMEHSSHCYQCAYGFTDLSLYLLRGHRLDAVLATQVAETSNTETEECPNAISNSVTVLSADSHRSHGLADLVLTTAVKIDPNSEDGAPESCAMEQPPTARTAHFDGRVYQVPADSTPRP